ncbi:Glyoxylase, beta-lactamase superfamily II [bacterium A37T11]|nr:Glyoxylase, beta-lactamase superfamily II [bacterium A37T11]
MQILRGLYQVGGDLNGITFDKEGAKWNDGNSYVLETPSGLLMFDCGCGDTMTQIVSNMSYWGLSMDHVKFCLLTHSHFDHAGGAHLLKKKGIKLLSSREAASGIAVGDERCCGYLYHKTFVPTEIDEMVHDGQVLNLLGVEMQVIHLPGHSMGCTAYSFLHDQKRVIVSGDVIGTLLGGDFGWDGSIDFDKKCYIESLKKFAKETMDIMLPGHGLCQFHNPRYRVEESLNAALMQWR